MKLSLQEEHSSKTTSTFKTEDRCRLFNCLYEPVAVTAVLYINVFLNISNEVL